MDDGGDAVRQLDGFLDRVVLPLEQEHRGLLGDPGRRYRPSGILAEPLLDLKRRVRLAAAADGVYGLMIPADLGGPGLGATAQYETWRHLYARCGPDRLLPYEAVGTFTSGPGAALGGLGTRARREVWPAILSGEKVLCFALTEASGETAGDLRTRAIPTEGGFGLSGQKKWVSRGGYAHYALTYAPVGPPSGPSAGGDGPPRLSAFLVPLAQPGVEVVAVNRLFGRAGGEEVTLSFQDVHVPEWQVVGELHGGGSVAASGSLATALFTAGRFVGLAEWALGRPAGGVDRRPLADHVSEVHGLHALARRCAERADAGERVDREVAMIRLSAAAVCGRVYERVMQMEGGESLTNEARLFDGWHQSWIVRVAQAAAEEGLRATVVDRDRRDEREDDPWTSSSRSGRPSR